MNLLIIRNFLGKSVLSVCLLCLMQSSLWAQAPAEPQQTRLLNGLRVRLLARPDDQNVLVKLRIHSGAAFDLAGKAGTAALLGDILFPDPATREYFTEEMQGRLNVSTDYDAITITMQGRAREFERIIEILRTALVSTDLSPANVAKTREGRIKVIRETSISPAIVADRAVAARLFGDFPYGRPYNGTVESLERVERPDVMFARERFLNPNNASLVVVGGIQESRAIRAIRQLLGGWRKSEQIIPATFKQPVPPDSRALIINAPNDQSVEIRLAVRGLSRKDSDLPAAILLASVVRQRWEKELPELSRSPVFVRHDAFALPGMFVMGTAIDPLLAGKALTSAQEIIKSLVTSPASTAEVAQARSDVLATFNKELAKAEGLADLWMDVDTYGVPSAAEQVRALTLVSPADLQRAATRLFHDGALAAVVVGNADLLKSQLERYGKVEVMGTVDPASENKPDQGSTKSETKTVSKPE